MNGLTYREAARRVGRSVRTIKRWRKGGMRMGWDHGRRVVDEQTLLTWFRARLSADPVHQARMRALAHKESDMYRTTDHENRRHER